MGDSVSGIREGLQWLQDKISKSKSPEEKRTSEVAQRVLPTESQSQKSPSIVQATPLSTPTPSSSPNKRPNPSVQPKPPSYIKDLSKPLTDQECLEIFQLDKHERKEFSKERLNQELRTYAEEIRKFRHDTNDLKGFPPGEKGESSYIRRNYMLFSQG